MDPLSISVAVIGLLSSADSIRRKLTTFARNATGATSIVETVLVEVCSIQAALPRLRVFIESDDTPAREFSFLDQLSCMLTGCVKRFSELETLLGGLPCITESESITLDTARWARNEPRITVLVERLQPYKLSLLLMLQLHELQTIRNQNITLEHIQSSIDDLKGRMFSSDADLAARMARREASITSYSDASVRSFDTSSYATTPELPPPSPRSARQLHSAADADKKHRGWWKPGKSRADEPSSRGRPPSIATTSSSSSAGTMSSGASISSRGSLATVDNASVYRLPISPQEISNGHHYIGAHPERLASLSESVTSLERGGFDDESDTASRYSLPTRTKVVEHHKALPILTRPDSRPDSAAGLRPSTSSRTIDDRSFKTASPLAELEMSARKYQGYWRAAFTANVPVGAAMCGCLLMAAGSGVKANPKLTESEEGAETAFNLVDLLAQASSPAQLLKILFAHDFEDVVFAVKVSLGQANIPVIPAKLAFSIYKEIDEAKDQPKKRAKVWEKVAKLLKKIPQETIVPMMFLIAVGRKLRARGMTVNGRWAGVYLLDCLWPQLGSKGLFASDTSSGDAASMLILENYDDLPDELPVLLQAVNYRFESGSRCNLMSLLSSKKGKGDRSGTSSSAS